MRASEMQEGRTYRTVGPIGELWPEDPEVVEIGTTVGDILECAVRPVEKGKQEANKHPWLRVKRVSI